MFACVPGLNPEIARQVGLAGTNLNFTIQLDCGESGVVVESLEEWVDNNRTGGL